MVNPIALRTAKTLWSFGYSECSRVNAALVYIFTGMFCFKNLFFFDSCMKIGK